MAEYKFDEEGVSFEVPDRPPVRKQLEYWSMVRESVKKGDTYLRLFEAAKTLVSNWQCEYMALDVDLDAADDPRMVGAIQAVGLACFAHMNGIEAIPKN